MHLLVKKVRQKAEMVHLEEDLECQKAEMDRQKAEMVHLEADMDRQEAEMVR